MTEEAQEVPKWLKELEEKRERRLKAKLGHEAGAGSPCLTCEDKCPGLDLHFWRKICKNCKCGKENHDVNDDDIYGWAQFQLLGSKPNKAKKIVLPGRREAVELEWTPRGHNDVVESYLKELPTNLLPIKGSAAAQERKQLLQKQIPLHDIDPTLCHALSENEIKQMNDYVTHLKQNSVGIGHIMKLNELLKNRLSVNAQILSSRAPMQLPQSQNTVLKGVEQSNALKAYTDLKQTFQDLSLQTPKQLIVNDIDYQHPINIGGIRDIVEQKSINLGNRKYVNQIPNLLIRPQVDFQSVQDPNNIKDINYPSQTLPNTINIQKPVNYGRTDHVYPDMNVNFDLGSINTKSEILDNMSNLRNEHSIPHYAPSKFNTFIEQQKPQKIGNIKDLAYTTYDMNNPKYSFPTNYNPYELNVEEQNVNPMSVNVGIINDIEYPTIKSALQQQNEIFQPEIPRKNVKFDLTETEILPNCHKCRKMFNETALVIGIDHTDALWHADCFKCNGCNQNLADLMYFYNKENDQIYCGRDYAKIRGIPRCQACDELIFVKEYCLAENSTFHVKHFCCFECDKPLAGQNYVMEDSQPLCLPCFEKLKAEKCNACLNVIKPDEQGANMNGVHFHADDECFVCKMCKKALLGAKFLFRNRNLYCSAPCFSADK